MNNKSPTIIGAIAGDVIGSVYETFSVKSKSFPLFNERSRFTDDTVLTIALADCLLHDKDFTQTFQDYGRRYPKKRYGAKFLTWIFSENPQPYNSFGNGSAMRVSAVGFAYDSLEEVLEIAKQSAAVTHNHPEGIKGAQAVASAIFLARKGNTKQTIKDYITSTFGYNLNFSLDLIRPVYEFDVTCQGSVPEAIVAFLESTDFEDAIRNAISLGGDSDTIACIAGGIAAAFYKEIPIEIIEFVIAKLPDEFIEILNQFDAKFA